MSGKNNQMIRFLLLIILAAGVSVFMYFLPENTPEFKIFKKNIPSLSLQKIDLLSDVRHQKQIDPDDDILSYGIAERNKITQNKDSIKISENTKSGNSISDRNEYKEDFSFYTSDSVVRFLDFSTNGSSFSKVSEAIKNNTAVRIAFIGDSFIEGDVFTEGVRSNLQNEYGGSGVGMVPMASNISGFRNSVNITGSNWQIHSLLNKKSGDRFAISGEFYTSSGNARTSITLPKKGKTTNAILYYKSSKETEISVSCDNRKTRTVILPETESINHIKVNDSIFNKINLSINNAEGFSSYGIALEKDNGITVDCFSIRGHSGLLLASIDREVNSNFLALRKYSLIVLEYGLNVANKKQYDYSGYRNKMKPIINKIKEDCPGIPILIMGVGDRCVRENGDIHTMPSIYKLEKEQLIMAKETNSMFWSTRLAMERLGGMSGLSKSGLADKDYTHLGHKGGYMLSKEWVKAFNNKIKE